MRTAPHVLSVCGGDLGSPAVTQGQGLLLHLRGGRSQPILPASSQCCLELGTAIPLLCLCARRRNANDRKREDNAEDAVNAPY